MEEPESIEEEAEEELEELGLEEENSDEPLSIGDLVKRFSKFVISSLSATAIDLALFTLLCALLQSVLPAAVYIGLATVVARIVSATYNCIINYKVVFKSSRGFKHALVRFALLATCIMAASAVGVTVFAHILVGVYPTFIKLGVDFALFFVNYYVQKTKIFTD